MQLKRWHIVPGEEYSPSLFLSVSQGSVLIAELMNRYPFLVTLGAGLLAWTDGRMIATDTVVSQAVAFEFGVNLKDGPLGLVVSFMMTAVVLVVSRQRNA